MKGSVIIPLSRGEEETMRLIGHGIANPRHLRAPDVDQLKKLRLEYETAANELANAEEKLRLQLETARVEADANAERDERAEAAMDRFAELDPFLRRLGVGGARGK